MAHSGIEQEIDKVNEIDDRKGNLDDFFLKNEFSLLLSKQYVALLNDLTCKCLPPSGLARQVSDILNSDKYKSKKNTLYYCYNKQHMLTTHHTIRPQKLPEVKRKVNNVF